MSRESELEAALDRLKCDRNDAGAWSAVYQRLWPFAYSVAYRAAYGNAGLAEEAAQEGFVRLLRYARFEKIGSVQSLRAYLAVTTQNAARTDLRAQSLLGDDDAIIEETAGRGADLEARMELSAILSSLKEEEAKLAMLVALGEGRKKIAQILEISDKSVGMRVHHLRAKLRRRLPDSRIP